MRPRHELRPRGLSALAPMKSSTPEFSLLVRLRWVSFSNWARSVILTMHGEDVADLVGALILEEGARAGAPERIRIVDRRLRRRHRHLHRLVAGLGRRIAGSRRAAAARRSLRSRSSDEQLAAASPARRRRTSASRRRRCGLRRAARDARESGSDRMQLRFNCHDAHSALARVCGVGLERPVVWAASRGAVVVGGDADAARSRPRPHGRGRRRSPGSSAWTAR